VYENNEALDTAVFTLAKRLAGYNSEALENMKSIFWEDAKDWDKLLLDRSKISGKLVLSDFTKKALSKFLKK